MFSCQNAESTFVRLTPTLRDNNFGAEKPLAIVMRRRNTGDQRTVYMGRE
jgi:hypothetical protein